MKNAATLVTRVVLSVVFVTAALVLPACKSQPPNVRYPYVLLWRDAERTCVPEYPESSIAVGSQGLAVAQLDIGADGSVRRVDILQAPDEAIARSVRECVARFRPRPLKLVSKSFSRGKLFFYFVNSGQGGMVYVANDPEQSQLLMRELAKTPRGSNE